MFKRILLSLFAALIISGCGRSERNSRNEPVEPPQSQISLLYEEAKVLVDQGDATGAIALLESALPKEEFAQDRERIFGSILSLLLEGAQYDAAVERHIAMASESATTAEYSYRMMEQSLLSSGNDQLLLSWSTAMLPISFSEATKSRVYVTHAYALVKNARTDDALALIPSCRNDLSTSMCMHIFRGMIQSYVGLQQLETAYAAIDKIAGIAGDVPELLELVAVSRLDLYGSENKWDEFIMLFGDQVEKISDAGLTYTINTAVGRMGKANKGDLAQQICVLVIDKREAEENCFNASARHWLELGAQSSPKDAPRKLRTLIDKGFPAQKLINMISKSYYALLDGENSEALTKMIALIKEIQPRLTEERDILTTRNMLLDGSFILNDYDAAIAMIEEGIPGHDENWHKSSLAKLKAHRALDAGEADDAVKYFREFMKVIEATMDRETDPSSGMVYTVNWCLGRNAKRIGDIHKEAGNEEKSKSAYKEAEGYFENALKDFRESSREHEAIKKEMALVPSSG